MMQEKQRHYMISITVQTHIAEAILSLSVWHMLMLITVSGDIYGRRLANDSRNSSSNNHDQSLHRGFRDGDLKGYYLELLLWCYNLCTLFRWMKTAY